MSTPKWTEIFSIGYGQHRVFRHNASGDLSLCDDSGTDPDQSDDGPLIVPTNAEMQVRSQAFGCGLQVRCPVVQTRATAYRDTYCAVHPKVAKYLLFQLPKATVALHPEVLALHALIEEFMPK